jgi:hypothetical protein
MTVKPDPTLTRLSKMLAGLRERPDGVVSGEAAARDLKEEFQRQNGEFPLTDAQRQAVRRAKIKAELEAKRRQHVRRCVACGLSLPVTARADAKTCSDACRKKMSRSR